MDTGEDSAGPSYGEITTISGFQGDYLEFEEYPKIEWDGKRGAWKKDLFREMQPPMRIKIENILHEKSL